MKSSSGLGRFFVTAGGVAVGILLAWSGIVLADTYLLRRPVSGLQVAGQALADLSNDQAQKLDALYDALVTEGKGPHCVYVQAPAGENNVNKTVSCPSGYRVAATGSSWAYTNGVGRICSVTALDQVTQYSWGPSTPVEHYRCDTICCKAG